MNAEIKTTVVFQIQVQVDGWSKWLAVASIDNELNARESKAQWKTEIANRNQITDVRLVKITTEEI